VEVYIHLGAVSGYDFEVFLNWIIHFSVSLIGKCNLAVRYISAVLQICSIKLVQSIWPSLSKIIIT